MRRRWPPQWISAITLRHRMKIRPRFFCPRRPVLPAGLKIFLGIAWLSASMPAFAHDASEITTRAFLRTNALELRLTIAASTAMAMAEADGHRVAALATAADVDAARTSL